MTDDERRRKLFLKIERQLEASERTIRELDALTLDGTDVTHRRVIAERLPSLRAAVLRAIGRLRILAERDEGTPDELHRLVQDLERALEETYT